MRMSLIAAQMDDEQLVELSKRNQQGAFSELVFRYMPKVRRLVTKILRREEDSMDITQEVFIKAFEKINTFEGRSAFSSWLFRVATNTCLMYLRKHKTRKFVSLEQSSCSPTYELHLAEEKGCGDRADVIYERKQIKATLSHYFYELENSHQEVLRLKDIMGWKNSEIADKLGLSVPAVKSRLHRARKELRKKIPADNTQTYLF